MDRRGRQVRGGGTAAKENAVSKHAFASRSKINAHSSRFETRAHWIVAQTLLYLCRLYIQCLLGTRTLFLFSFLFPVPFFLSRSFIFFPSFSLSLSLYLSSPNPSRPIRFLLPNALARSYSARTSGQNAKRE